MFNTKIERCYETVKKIKDNLLPMMLIILIPIINIFYGYLNNSLRGVHNLVTDLDRSVPFLKIFAIPYLMLAPFIAITLIYFCIFHRKVYYKVISSLVIGMVICFIIYFLFQTTVPRPKLIGDDALTSIVSFIYNSDNPFNCFPSIHVLFSYLMIIGVKKSDSKSLVINSSIYLISSLIILSTQFIKQHVILDLIFAILLAEGIYKVVDNFNLERCLLWIRKPSWWWTMKKKLEI